MRKVVGMQVEGNAVRCSRHFSVDERGDLPSESVEDLQRDKRRLGQLKPDRGRRVKRIGVILRERELFRKRINERLDTHGGRGALIQSGAV